MVSLIRGLIASIGGRNPAAQTQRPVASGPIQTVASTTLSSSASTTVSGSTRALMNSNLVEERKSSVISHTSQSSRDSSKGPALTQEFLALQKVGAVAASLQMTSTSSASTSSSQADSTPSLSSASTSTSSTPLVRSKELWDLLEQQTIAQLALLKASEKDFLLSKEEMYIAVSLSITDGCVRRTAIKDGEKFLNANYISYEGVRINFVGSLFVPTICGNSWDFIFNQEYAVLDLLETEKRVLNYPIEVEKEYNFQGLGIPTPFSMKLVKRTLINGSDSFTSNEYQVTFRSVVKTITRWNFNAWPEGRAISVDQLTILVDEMRNRMGNRIFVHCRAGIGRTGTAITACILAELIDQKRITLENLDDQLIHLILELRKQRRGLVLTFEQFDLLRNYGQSRLAMVSSR